MEFEWDENKNVENIKYHDGITFEEAVSVFFDKWALDVFDDSHSDADEQRFTLIGLAGERLLRVTYTIRKNETGEEIIRIISARKAKGYEKKDYDETRNRLDIRSI
ncbi:MAG: BrnT family toxin [Acidobacteriota bacterium]|nr:BrnT family toxin [Acidobacteriota bacterium]